ncbi:Ger(x)C family spore germination protein [Bacillus sp. SD088]|nr:Ger(x)C family spore germination protein [Bacillus sp. SD088]
MTHNVKLYLILILSLCLLTGCWDKKELTDIAFVAAMGIDKGENGQYVGTFQIINPSNVAGGLQGGSGQDGATVTVYRIPGENMVDVSRRAANEISRVLFYSHANLVVIGEELAKEEGIDGILDGLDRDDRFRDTSKVVIARGATASELMQITTPIDKIPANKVIKTLRFSEQQWGEQWPVKIRDILNALTSTGKEPIIPSFSIYGDRDAAKSIESLQRTSPDAIIRTNGLGIFKDGKLMGWLHDEQARGTAWIMNKIRSTNIAIDWEEEMEAISFQVVREKTKVKFEFDGNQIIAKLDIQTQGDLGEVNVPINLKDRRIRNQIEKKVEKEIEHMIRSTITEVQSYQADIFGFGEKIYHSHPKKWRQIEEDWQDQYFPEMKVEVGVDAMISGTGLRSNSFKYIEHD